MRNKLIAILSIFILVLSIPMVGFADSINPSDYQITIPEEDVFFSKNDTTLILGYAPKDTEIKIEIYGAADLNKKEYSIEKLPEEEDYVLMSTLELVSGALGFAEEVELISGVNKIIVYFNVEDVGPIERIVYYNAKDTNIHNLRMRLIVPLAQ